MSGIALWHNNALSSFAPGQVIPHMPRPVQALIDLSAFRHNYRLAKRFAAPARAWAVIKANGYGHGAVALAQALPQADGFAVASLEEALELREAGIVQPILLLGGFFAAAELGEIARLQLETVIHSPEQLALLEAARLDEPLSLWLKLDTGMHRLGLNEAQLHTAIGSLREARHCLHLMTHLACADDLECDATERQLQCFRAMTAGLSWPASLANSAGLVAWPETRADWVRPGIMLYGSSPFVDEHPIQAELQPVMTLASRVVAIREIASGEAVGYGQTWRAGRPSRIGTVAVGYGDGYPRHAPSGTPVLVNGRRTPLVGRVSMDSIGIDLTDRPEVGVGDEVVLWGRGLDINEVARAAGTISYELLTGVSVRVPRLFMP